MIAVRGERRWRARRRQVRLAEAAFEQGLGAYKAGYYEMAIPALEEAADQGHRARQFFAEFYLARIYSDNASAHTDHAKAYMLFRKLADENADIDPDDDQRAPFVAKALTALAGYSARGVAEIGVRPIRSAPSTTCTTRRPSSATRTRSSSSPRCTRAAAARDDVKRGMH